MNNAPLEGHDPNPLPGIFVTATGTEVGKTLVSCALVYGLRELGKQVTAVKPAETGCTPDPLDALRLARVCEQAAVAQAKGLYRVAPPLAPAAAARELEEPPPESASLVSACLQLRRPGAWLLVEGAGGLLVPLNERETFADFAVQLALPLVLVAPDELGTLSHSLATYEAAEHRGLRIAALVLNQVRPGQPLRNPQASNQALLAERLPVPVCKFPYQEADTPEALLRSVQESGLLQAVFEAGSIKS